MQIEAQQIPDVYLIIPSRFGDARGFFSESWSRKKLADAGLSLPEFVQDNHSMSHHVGTVRGLHYQSPPHAQGKLVRCGRGKLFDVAVDARRGSPTYGQWVGADLSYDNGHQLWIPAGFLHGFVTREPDTEIIYKCTANYNRGSDGAVRWDSLGIDWASDDPLLSDKDRDAPAFADWSSPFLYEAKR